MARPWSASSAEIRGDSGPWPLACGLECSDVPGDHRRDVRSAPSAEIRGQISSVVPPMVKTVDRRTFIRSAAGGGLAAMPIVRLCGQAPAIVMSDTDRPDTPQGVASGDVSMDRAVVWSRADRPARVFVEYSTTERFENVRRVPGPAALEPSDFTSRVVLTGLPGGQRIFYRVLFQDRKSVV